MYKANRPKQKKNDKTQIVAPERNSTFGVNVYEIWLDINRLQNRTTKKLIIHLQPCGASGYGMGTQISQVSQAN